MASATHDNAAHDPTTNVEDGEIGKFDAIAGRFWDEHGPFRPLHQLNPQRVRFITEHSTCAGARVLDVGCGGGLVCEALARCAPPRSGGRRLLLARRPTFPRSPVDERLARAILAGDEETGVCVMALEEGLDTGPVHARAAVRIGADERADALRERLRALGTDLLLALLAGLPGSLAHPVPQQGEATYAAKIRPEERRLDWQRPALELGRVVRVGRAFTTWRGRRLLVHRAHPVAGSPGGAPPGTLRVDGRVVTGDGLLELVEVQPEGRSVQPVGAFLAGARLAAPGERLGA